MIQQEFRKVKGESDAHKGETSDTKDLPGLNLLLVPACVSIKPISEDSSMGAGAMA